jgi:pimeloyl-ACP methyl ester carboxylesterase
MSLDLASEKLNGADPHHAIAFLHGILGRGTNLRTIAKQFISARPDWSAWLVDLRGHGRSPKSTPNPSIEAAAEDVLALAAKSDLPLAALAGHSFGGKVALEAGRLNRLKSLRHIVTIDSVPGSRAPLRDGDSALAVIDSLESLPKFESRTEFIRALMAAGQTRTLAEWLAGSVEKEGESARFALDLHEIRGLIYDYFARDLWPVVEHPPDRIRVHLIVADQSDSYSPADRARAMSLAASNDQVTVDVLPGGHWLHVDNPEGLLARLLERVTPAA